MYDANAVLLNVMPEGFRKLLLMELMPMFMGDPFPEIMMSIGSLEGIYFFMLREHEAIMKPMQVERVFQRGKLVPRVCPEVGNGSTMYFLETMILNYRYL